MSQLRPIYESNLQLAQMENPVEVPDGAAPNQQKPVDVDIVLCSANGPAHAFLALYDTIQAIQTTTQVFVRCAGEVSYLSALLICAATPGNRHAYPNLGVILGQSAANRGLPVSSCQCCL